MNVVNDSGSMVSSIGHRSVKCFKFFSLVFVCDDVFFDDGQICRRSNARVYSKSTLRAPVVGFHFLDIQVGHFLSTAQGFGIDTRFTRHDGRLTILRKRIRSVVHDRS
jgi:hypothetical protein